MQRKAWTLERMIIICCLALLSMRFIAGLLMLSFGGDNIDVLRGFDTDEALGLHLLEEAWKRRDFTYVGDIVEHGTLHSIVAGSLIFLLDACHFSITEKLMIYCLRAISLISFAFVLYYTFHMLRKLQLRTSYALLGVVLTSSLLDFQYYSQIIHPDMLQLALLMAAWNAVLGGVTFRKLILSSILCGLAIAAKWGAVFALPFLILTWLLKVHFEDTERQFVYKRTLKSFIEGGFAAFSAILTFVIVTPQVWRTPVEYWTRFNNINAIVRSGWDEVNPPTWTSVISPELPTAWFLLLGIGWLITAMFVLRAKSLKNSFNRDFLVIFLFLLTSSLYLLISVKLKGVRYAYHILPIFICGGLLAIRPLEIWLKTRKEWIAIALPLVLLSGIFPVWKRSMAELSKFSTRYESPEYQAYDWIQNNLPYGQVIAADIYVIPINKYRWETRGHSWYQARFNLDADLQNADTIIFSRQGSGRYAWKKQNTRLEDDQFEIFTRFGSQGHDFVSLVRRLMNGEADWNKVYETNEFIIFSRHRVGTG